MNDDTEEKHVMVIDETEKAYQFESKEHGVCWFPKSQVSFSRRNIITKEATAVIPVWLLDKNDW